MVGEGVGRFVGWFFTIKYPPTLSPITDSSRAATPMSHNGEIDRRGGVKAMVIGLPRSAGVTARGIGGAGSTGHRGGTGIAMRGASSTTVGALRRTCVVSG